MHNHPRKINSLRYAEYYDMQPVFDELYAKSQQGAKFKNLMKIILSEQNILLAYRNIKRSVGGGDNYSNLVIVHKDVHELIHAATREGIDKRIHLVQDDKTLKKLNELRARCMNAPIEVRTQVT